MRSKKILGVLAVATLSIPLMGFSGIKTGIGIVVGEKIGSEVIKGLSHKERAEGRRSEAEQGALYSEEQKRFGFQSCQSQIAPGARVDPSAMPRSLGAIGLCSDAFAVLYSSVSKTPLIVMEKLDAARLSQASGEERTDDFYPDPRLQPGQRAELEDYRAMTPPVDRGHQSPAADAPNVKAMHQSFALSNMVPQDPTNNRKIWSKIESDVRKYAKRADGPVYVFTGPIFDPGHAYVGRNHVWKPTRLFKLVYDQRSNRAWAYIIANAAVPINPPVDYAVFRKETGWTFLDTLNVKSR